ncbi:type II secretion system F family protein [Candidatus Paraluminiphilus aquimaris]|uniref:Type II secretion system F family protein n=1 Tax=Candidatus Paraluminiphilus aquimaris TaxID=2518994 RepID=A0ABY6Q7Z2_9GAMM|nr:type II secretion system F family protein [Candidatus Paraluminiphilus aquimaris]UZP75407.1 type II secretion system F family protein [Candidatus Paraluminiphilus aquimaris]
MARSEITFIWSGVDRTGRTSNGEVNAPSVAIAKAQLRRQGINAKRLRKKTQPLLSMGKAIDTRDIAVFTRQLATMTRAGVPMVQAIDIVMDGTDKALMKDLIRQIRNDVSGGAPVATSFGKHRKHFDELYCSLVAAGENSGTLEVMLDRIAIYKEKTEALKATIKKALTYPIATVLVAIVVTGILLINVVPQFASTFESFGSELPAFTQFVVGVSNLLQAWWMSIGGAFALFIISFNRLRLGNRKFANAIDAGLLKAPIFGKIVHDAVIARYSRTLSTTFAAGVPLVEALDATATASGNALYERAIKQMRNDVTSGLSLLQATRATGIFPMFLLQMTSIGEESGTLDEMLGKVADQYEMQVDNAVESISSLIEPMIMSVLGIIIGGLMIAMYLPIFMLGSVI